MTVNTQRLNYRLLQADLVLPQTVTKRDGSRTSFDITRIDRAVMACYSNLEETPKVSADRIVESVATAIASKFGTIAQPTVEQIQDLVEVTLLAAGEVEAARSYIAYRDSHAKARGQAVPQSVRDIFDTDALFFPTSAQRFSFYDKYSKFNWDYMRRETWPETVRRCVAHLRWEVQVHVATLKGQVDAWDLPDWELDLIAPVENLPISVDTFERIEDAILKMQIMPSMRLLAMAGPAARRNSMALYNCSYLPIKDITAFVETLLISMAGCGVGFSVERDYVEQFPRIKRQTGIHRGTHVIVDTTEGWAETLRMGLETWWRGEDLDFDAQFVRKAGSVLRTKGGRASGPEPLMEMLKAVRAIILSRQGTYLRTTDAHKIECWIGQAAVQGGVRRTAMIALFDWDDADMRTVKNGPTPEFCKTSDGSNILWNANNSAVWPEDIRDIDIMKQMVEMIDAYSGEPGIFSRHNAVKTMPSRRKPDNFGTNPCGEIILRPFEFCNLSQAVARPGDTEEDLREKVELATIVGKIQSLSTRFPGLRDEWKANCEEERLLGVDLTAQNDCEILRADAADPEGIRMRLANVVNRTDAEISQALRVNVSAATTCNKPAGNSTEFIGASSNGIHRPHAPFFKRRMLVSVHSPLFRVLREAGAPMTPQSGKSAATATKWVVTFPKRAPEGAPVKGDASAVEQCEFWLLNKTAWTEHNPSCTITYRADEIADLVKWVIDHKDQIGGLSFFPTSDAIYDDQPFEEISEEEYHRLVAEFPEIDYSLVYAYEQTDMTTAAQELACFAGDGSCSV